MPSGPFTLSGVVRHWSEPKRIWPSRKPPWGSLGRVNHLDLIRQRASGTSLRKVKKCAHGNAIVVPAESVDAVARQ